MDEQDKSLDTRGLGSKVIYSPSDLGASKDTQDDNQEVTLGMRELYPSMASNVTEGLKDHGVEVMFGVHGGELWGLVDLSSRAGIRIITFRHEQCGPYAAEAYAKVTRKAGVFFADSGPGAANAASALQQAYLSCSPVVGIVGCGWVGQERSITLQPSNAEQLYGKMTKWTQRITVDWSIKNYIYKAFKDAYAHPQGPCVLEISASALIGRRTPDKLSLDTFAKMVGEKVYTDRWRGEDTGMPITSPGGDPKLVEETVRRLCQAKNPVIYVGDNAHWTNAGPELVEFAELAQVPVTGRRLGRGAMPETHPLHFSSRINHQAMQDCDLLVSLGVKIGFFDSNYGSDWPLGVIQINESQNHIFEHVDTSLIIVAGAKTVLRQMIDCFKNNSYRVPPGRQDWVVKLQRLQREADERLHAKALKYQNHSPLHFGYLCKVVWDTCEELYGGMNRIIVDGFSVSGYIPPFPKTRYSAQIMDASENGGVGHGIGMAIGAAIGDPETYKHPIIVLLGDSGIGNAGMDVETATRYRLPIVYLVTNNDGWLGGMKYMYYGKNWDVMGPQDRPLGQAFLPNLRYEKIAEMCGGHGEYISRPEELRPGLERALRAAEEGKTAVVNVIMDPTVVNPIMYSMGYAMAYGHIPWDELPKRGKTIRRKYCWMLPWEKTGISEPPALDPWAPIPPEEWEP